MYIHLISALCQASRNGGALLGLLYIAAGVYVLWNPILGLVSLTLGLAAYLVVEAMLEFILAVRLRPAPGSGWLFVDAIITLILAVIIWRTWPLSAAWVIGTLVGISMIFSGMARLMLSIAARRLIRKRKLALVVTSLSSILALGSLGFPFHPSFAALVLLLACAAALYLTARWSYEKYPYLSYRQIHTFFEGEAAMAAENARIEAEARELVKKRPYGSWLFR